MKGVIKTYLASKGYGFIKGDDGNDYYFRSNDERALSGARVEFKEIATPKGYAAKNLRFLEEACECYELPESFVISKGERFKDYEILSTAPLAIARDNTPDACYDALKAHARSIGANALLNCRYDKETRSVDNYKYSHHCITARPAFIAKKSYRGSKVEIPKLEGTKPFKHEHDKHQIWWLASLLLGVVGLIIFTVYFF